ncbi:MAG: bifunctional hydroxymethylpyrimidine kinase/phosphomethylpyrimidine kinase, partial [Oscillospiraceae bacterium]|nr:bifunctional hydroxymethylpyrimidine kinase/phosphomethylpyrimidine kinase [Candidatus Equicaccousia limihippi]
GAACYNAKTGEISYSFAAIVDKMYHGTGDLFTSSLLSAYLCGKTLEEATAVAVEFTAICIKDTKENFPDMWYGVNFERNLPQLINKVK